MHITKSAYRRLAASASISDRGAEVARHTPLIAKRRAARAREAYVFDRESGVARHTPLIAERLAQLHCVALRSATRMVAVLSLQVAFKSTYNLPDISPKRNR